MSLKLTLPEAIRSIRMARQMKTAEFAREIGVAQSIVSRYESGGRSPGKRVLLKLMLMARDAEKETIRAALSKVCHGEPIKDSEARRIALCLAQEDELLKQVVSYVNLSNRGRFLSLSAGIAESKMKIDDSLNKILSIWFTSEHTPDVVRHFHDAARFLEIALVPGSGETIEPVVRALTQLGLIAPNDEPIHGPQSEDQAAARASYRVILPVDLGDGRMRAFGDIVDLDLATAKEYAQALIGVETSSHTADEAGEPTSAHPPRRRIKRTA